MKLIYLKETIVNLKINLEEYLVEIMIIKLKINNQIYSVEIQIFKLKITKLIYLLKPIIKVKIIQLIYLLKTIIKLKIIKIIYLAEITIKIQMIFSKINKIKSHNKINNIYLENLHLVKIKIKNILYLLKINSQQIKTNQINFKFKNQIKTSKIIIQIISVKIIKTIIRTNLKNKIKIF